MEIDRNFSFLCNVDLKKFVLNESKKQIQSTGTIQMRHGNQRPTVFEVFFTHSFSSETLITNIQILCSNIGTFDSNFESVQIQVSSLVNRGHYEQLINLKSQKQASSIVFSGAGFTHCIKINMIVRNDPKRKNSRNGQKQLQESLQKIISQSIKDINIYGVTINSNPSPILLTKLLNISQSFKKYNLLQEAAETDLLVSLSLINARRFIQAAEILRKVSKFYIEKFTNSKLVMDLTKTERSWIKDQKNQEEEHCYSTIMRSNFGSGRTLQGNKFLQRAAKIELLIAQTVSHPSLVLQKLQAYHRCNCFSSGNTSPIALAPNIDIEDISLIMFPQVVPFLLKMLSDKLQPLRVAALKSIQFFIETLGCSIGNSFVLILKQVINTYPCHFLPQINAHRAPYGLQQIQINEKVSEGIETGAIIKNKILIDHYHHLLETLLTLIGQINRKMIHTIFAETLLPAILSKSPSYELKLYLLRFTEKSISISGADLNIQPSFIGLLLNFCEQKSINKPFITSNKSAPKGQQSAVRQQSGVNNNRHIIHNLVYFSHKIINALKTKVFPRYSGTKLQQLLQWINKTLTYLGENQLLSNVNFQHSFFVFNTVLQFIVSIYSVLKFDYMRIKYTPIQTLLYFTNMALTNQQAGLPFDKIIETLAVLLKYHCCTEPSFQLNRQIISRILQKSKEHNLSLKQLQIMIKVLQISNNLDQFMLEWLETYLDCIPHSTYDQTYQVFCIMLQKGMIRIKDHPHSQDLLKKIVKTMLDQYTVKGKAHQQAKQTLIDSLIKSKPEYILDLIQVCLFDNEEPKPQKYYSKKKPKAPSKMRKEVDHLFDSKGYKIDFEMFMQKISMAQLIFTQIASSTAQQILIEQKFIIKLFEYCKNLAQASSFKLKSRGLSLVNHYLDITSTIWKKQKIELKPFVLIIRNVLNLNKLLVPKLKQSKLMYSIMYSTLKMYRCYQSESNTLNFDEQNLNKLYQEIEESLKSQIFKSTYPKANAQKFIHLFMLREFVKIWPILGQSMHSPWQNVRQIYILLITEVLRDGLHQVPHSLKKKILQITKPLMFNLFTSAENSQRLSALKIFGCLLGLRGNYEGKTNKIGEIICENLRYLKPFTERVFQLTFDWVQKNTEIAENLCSICISQQNFKKFESKRKQMFIRKGYADLQNSFLSFNLGEEMNLQKKNMSMFVGNSNLENLLLKQSWLADEQQAPIQHGYSPNITDELLNKIYQFKNLIEKQIQTKIEALGEKQSFMQQNQQQFYDIGQEKAESVDAIEKSEDDQLQFEDLGIIQLDDEQWGDQQQKEQKAIQKLPLKKIYKLSPGVLNSTKPQRIRSKRFHQNQFDYREKIIVDELEQKITSSNINQPIENLSSSRTDQIEQEKNSIKNSLQQKRNEKVQKNEQMLNKNNNYEIFVQNMDRKQEESQEEEIEFREDRNSKQKWQKQMIKKQAEKEFGMGKQKQRESEKKVKKSSSTRKRKASIGK